MKIYFKKGQSGWQAAWDKRKEHEKGFFNKVLEILKQPWKWIDGFKGSFLIVIVELTNGGKGS